MLKNFKWVVISVVFMTFVSSNVWAQEDKSVKKNSSEVSTPYSIDLDLSLPVTYLRCKETSLVETYLNALDKADSAGIQKVLDYLYACRTLVDNSLKEKKAQLKLLQEQEQVKKAK